jgi:hypothetical protein
MSRFGIAGLLVLNLLGGCALWPISEAECKPESWHQRGYDDGFGGHPPQDLRLASECRRFGVEVSEKDYLAGYGPGRLEWERLWGSMNKGR